MRADDHVLVRAGRCPGSRASRLVPLAEGLRDRRRRPSCSSRGRSRRPVSSGRGGSVARERRARRRAVVRGALRWRRPRCRPMSYWPHSSAQGRDAPLRSQATQEQSALHPATPPPLGSADPNRTPAAARATSAARPSQRLQQPVHLVLGGVVEEAGPDRAALRQAECLASAPARSSRRPRRRCRARPAAPPPRAAGRLAEVEAERGRALGDPAGIGDAVQVEPRNRPRRPRGSGATAPPRARRMPVEGCVEVAVAERAQVVRPPRWCRRSPRGTGCRSRTGVRAATPRPAAPGPRAATRPARARSRPPRGAARRTCRASRAARRSRAPRVAGAGAAPGARRRPTRARRRGAAAAAIRAGVGDRSERVRRQRERHHARALAEQRLERVHVERPVGGADRGPAHHQVVVARHQQPGRHVGVVVEVGDHDLVARRSACAPPRARAGSSAWSCSPRRRSPRGRFP